MPAAREHSASADRRAAEDDSNEEEPHGGALVARGDQLEVGPRTNLSQDAISELRARRKQLKREQKRVRQEMKTPPARGSGSRSACGA